MASGKKNEPEVTVTTEAPAGVLGQEEKTYVVNDDPALFDQLWERHTVTGEGALSAKPVIPRRRITFQVDGDECAPGMFVDGDGNPLLFRLTLEALSAAKEVEVTRDVQDPATAVQYTARASIVAMNGRRINDPGQLDFLWEALAPQGRQLVMHMYRHIGSLSPVGLGKALTSSEVS